MTLYRCPSLTYGIDGDEIRCILPDGHYPDDDDHAGDWKGRRVRWDRSPISVSESSPDRWIELAQS